METTPDPTRYEVTDPVFAARIIHRRPGPKSIPQQLQRSLGPPGRPVALPVDPDELHIASRLEDDPPWQPGPATDHPFESLFHDNDGRPIPFEPHEEFLRRMVGVRTRIAFTSLYDRGAPIRVSTVFLRTDIAFHGPLMLWETMLFTGHPRLGWPGREIDGWAWRYSTQRAAVVGHGRIVQAIRAARRSGRRTAGRR